MFHVVLFEPEIPPNTGNIIRLCANTGVSLHLIHPLGFKLEDSRLRRAGLDYQEWAKVQEYSSWLAFIETVQPRRIFAYTTKGIRFFHEIEYGEGDGLLFGPETRGLPDSVLTHIPAENRLRIPMLSYTRSLNLSNAVAVAVYEAWRQWRFKGAV
jgi:tRNA (cytidine/uridine-2'-O-)-methyltransferase